MAKINVKPQYKSLVKMFDNLTGRKSMYNVFQDCIEMFALSIQNTCEVYPARRETYEKRYLDIISQYNDKEVNIIVQIFAEIIKMLEENPFQDLLGDLYMQLNMGSDALGQVFTPYNLSYMMGKLVFNKDVVIKEIEERGYIKLLEPCIGGGANIIGILECFYESGINYQKNIVIVGQDLSRIAVYMSYIVLSLLGCQAVIKCGDTLCNPYTCFINEVKDTNVMYTPMLIMNNGYLKV